MSIPARYKVVKALAIAAGLVMTLGVGFTPAQAAAENPNPSADVTFVDPSCTVDKVVVNITDTTPPGVGSGYGGISYWLYSSRGVELAPNDSVNRLSSFTLDSKPLDFGETVTFTVKAQLDTPQGAPPLVVIDSFTATRRSAASCVTPSPLKSVTPAAPTFVDKAGTKDDTYTVPSTVGVKYTVSGVVVAAGTYPAKGKVTVVAKAKTGFVLKGTSTWTHQFTNVVLPKPKPTPEVVFNPKASISSQCEFADGERTGDTVVDVFYDNSKSSKLTGEVGFELVEVRDGGTPKFYHRRVAGGKVAMLQRFYSSANGKTVKLTVNALDAPRATYTFKTKKCAVSVVVVPPKHPKPVVPQPRPRVHPSKPPTVVTAPKPVTRTTSSLPVPAKVQTDGGELGTSERGILPLGVGFVFIAGGCYMIRRREARS